MNLSPESIIIVVALVAAAILFYVLHKRTKATAGTVASLGNAVTQSFSDLRGHITKEAEAVKTRVATVGSAVVEKVTGGSAPAQPALALTPAASAPAAPAASVAAAPPPVAAAHADSPQPAPSAEGSRTAHTVSAVRNQYGSCDFAGKVPAAQCSLDDAFYLNKMARAFQAAVGAKLRNAELFYCLLSGTQAQIGEVINNALSTHAPQSIAFDASKYSGPMEHLYEQLVQEVAAGSVVYQVLYSDTGKPV